MDSSGCKKGFSCCFPFLVIGRYQCQNLARQVGLGLGFLGIFLGFGRSTFLLAVGVGLALGWRIMVHAQASHQEILLFIQFSECWARGGLEHHPNNFLEDKSLAEEVDWRGPATVKAFDSTADGLLGCIYAWNGEGHVLGHEGDGIALFDASVALMLANVLPKVFERLNAFLGLDVWWDEFQGVCFDGDGDVA